MARHVQRALLPLVAVYKSALRLLWYSRRLSVSMTAAADGDELQTTAPPSLSDSRLLAQKPDGHGRCRSHPEAHQSMFIISRTDTKGRG